MLPVIALVGHPNVGKSTLFNLLTRSRDALVADQPGLTRDRQYGIGRLGERPYLVVDTGGLNEDQHALDVLMGGQAQVAVQEADAVLFLVDAKAGLTAADIAIAQRLRRVAKPIVLVVNKSEGLGPGLAAAEFMGLGLGEPHAISAAHHQGVGGLMEHVLAATPAGGIEEQAAQRPAPWVAVVGRPNVGKSTLVNRFLGEERVLAFDEPGTTRDSIFVPFTRGSRAYTLIDTAGVRRRGRVTDKLEKFSVIKTLQSIEQCHVVILVLDARLGVSEQDARLLGYVLDAGRALVIAVNKWDGLEQGARETVKRDLARHLPFVDFARVHFISALEGTGLSGVLDSVDRAYESATRKLPTPILNRVLQDAVAGYPPPVIHGRRIKLRYAHLGGRNPPVIVVHGNQTEAVPESYRRYLANVFRRTLELEGTPLRVEFKGGENPYGGRRNVLTTRQVEKRKRLMRHVKKGPR